MSDGSVGFWQVPGGPRLGVRQWGSSGPLIVLLHGLAGSSAHYTMLAPTLVDAGWQVVAPDFRGHGDSERVPGTYVIEHYAADIEALLEMHHQPAVVAGHSLGGAVAVYLAGARPDLVRAAFAEDPPLYHGMPGVMEATGPVSAFRATQATMRELQAAGSDPAAIREMLEAQHAIDGRLWAETVEPETVAAKTESFAKADPDVWTPAIAGEALSGWNPERPVGVPLTILRADATLFPALLPDQAARIAVANPSARIIEVIGAGHHIREFLPSYDTYLAELLTFLLLLD